MKAPVAFFLGEKFKLHFVCGKLVFLILVWIFNTLCLFVESWGGVN